jgi:uncharacterized protein YjbJ (UPF0337 family)
MAADLTSAFLCRVPDEGTNAGQSCFSGTRGRRIGDIVKQEYFMPDHDRIEGAAKNIGGQIKEGLGKLTGDEKLKAEGRADRVEGKVQNAVGGVKDSLRDADKRN